MAPVSRAAASRQIVSYSSENFLARIRSRAATRAARFHLGSGEDVHRDLRRREIADPQLGIELTRRNVVGRDSQRGDCDQRASISCSDTPSNVSSRSPL